MAQNSASSVGHPAPNRGKENKFVLTMNLFGVPALWVAQMSFSEILSSYACYPHRTPLLSPLWEHLPMMLAIISIICFAGGSFVVITAWLAWRKLTAAEAKHDNHVIEVGKGRAKFLAMIGNLSSSLFLIAIGFTACAFIVVSPCGG